MAKGIHEGYIIAVACKDDCSFNLSENGMLWFANMGSTEILKVGFRIGFAFIATIGK